MKPIEYKCVPRLDYFQRQAAMTSRSKMLPRDPAHRVAISRTSSRAAWVAGAIALPFVVCQLSSLAASAFKQTLSRRLSAYGLWPAGKPREPRSSSTGSETRATLHARPWMRPDDQPDASRGVSK